nr:uncharacterized protein LOC110090488 [Pogona vitticeps]
MASIREVSRIAEDLLCPVCLSIFQDPRMLGCGHNFCLSCLESCISSKGRHEGSCPECRKPFSLQEAAHNRVLANLSEKARLLKLEGPGGTGSWYFCEEHEEPLKLFCSQDEAPICVICRDLPQHQSHSFLPIKNAVKVYQEKLKASLEPLEDGVKRATSNQSRQLETIEELESLHQNLCGSIFIAFEELREILNEKEQAMMETVKQMKEDNQADMESRLEHLKARESSHTETLGRIQATLEETNEFAFLKDIKELMRQVQDCLREESEETGSEDIQGPKEGEEDEDKEAEGNEAECKGDEDIPGEGEVYGEETHDTTEDEDGTIIPVDPALRELEVSLDFEAWKEMLGSISIETCVLDFPYYSPPQGENMFLSEGISDGAKEETAVREESGSTTEIGTSLPGEGSLDKQMPLSSSICAGSPTVESTPFKPPLCFPPFPVPVFEQWPIFSNLSVRGGMTGYQWTPHSRRGHGVMSQGRGSPQRQPPCSSVGQGRGYYPNAQRFQVSAGNYGHQGNWRSPRNETTQLRGGYARRRGGGSNQQRPQSTGGDTSGQSGGDFIKQNQPKSRGVHVSGQEGGRVNNQDPQSGRSTSSGDSKGESTSKQPFTPRGGYTARRGGSGRIQGSAKTPPAPQKEGETISGTKGSPNTAQSSRRKGRGRGSGSTKNK